MKALALAVLLLNLLSFDLSNASEFPIAPEMDMTPGQLCTRPDSYRYPERIAYCKRDVRAGLKRKIISNYDRAYGYTIEQMPRNEFKIDHYIPLCMGGSNDESNLWPQHQSIYRLTDELEETLCEKMKEGKIRQKEAVTIIVQAKHDLDKVPRILQYLRGL